MMTTREEEKMKNVRDILKQVELIAEGVIRGANDEQPLPHTLDLVKISLDALIAIVDDRNKL